MRLACLAILMLASVATAGEVVVPIPAGAKITASSAKSSAEAVQGKIRPAALYFTLRPDVKYDIRLEYSDGRVDQGMDTSWYDSETADPKTASMDDDDRQQIHSILNDIKSFYDRTESIGMWGDHDRAVVLVQRIRDSKFHSGAKNECIWCIEVWYLQNEAGGWAKVSQQDKMLRRERFDSPKKMQQAIDRIRWRPELGGVKVSKDETKTIQLTPAPADASHPPSPAPAEH